MKFKLFGIILTSLLTLQFSQAADQSSPRFFCFVKTTTNAHNPENHNAESEKVYGEKNEEQDIVAKQTITGTTIEFTASLDQNNGFAVSATNNDTKEVIASAFVGNLVLNDDRLVFAVKVPLSESQQESHLKALRKIKENADLAGNKANVSVKCDINR